MSKPRNPQSYWNRLNGTTDGPALPHTVLDIQMRDDKEPVDPDKQNHVACTCGFEARTRTAEQLSAMYAAHHEAATGRRAEL